jgi:PAS domain S-box-containing protein
MPTVLLVDDEPNMRWTMGEFLKREGFAALTAADYESALAHFSAARIDAAVVDIVLPGKSGIELLNELHRREPDLPVIMITGEPDLSQIPEIVRAGAYDFASKPVVKDVLLKAVRRAVEKKRLTEEKQRLEAELQQYTTQLETRVAERTAELAKAHNFLNTVLDSSTEYAIVAADTAGRITLYNRGAELLLGYPAAAAIGASRYELIAVADPADKPLLDAVRAAAAGGGRQQMQVRLRRADASAFVASLTVTPIRAPAEQLLGFLTIIRDITSEQEHEEAMRRMQERLFHNEKIAALGRVAAQVAHEVRNPLTGLLLYAMHLKSQASDKLAGSELSLVDKIIDTVNHLAATVERIVNFARPVKLSPRPVDLNHIVRRACQLLEPQVHANLIEKHLLLADEEVTGQFDEASLTSALINLLLNAIQAMAGGGGGRLTVTTGVGGDRIRLTITDTGCGMSAAQVANVFEPFYTTKSFGLGLGMSYARKVIEQHEGAIQVTSEQGAGTQILIELPARK